jgi:hypothetical protein
MASERYRFGRFSLDPVERRLWLDTEPVDVTARYLDALILLVREQGSLITKERFLEEVWRGVPVTDEALTQCIKTAAAPRRSRHYRRWSGQFPWRTLLWFHGRGAVSARRRTGSVFVAVRAP